MKREQGEDEEDEGEGVTDGNSGEGEEEGKKPSFTIDFSRQVRVSDGSTE